MRKALLSCLLFISVYSYAQHLNFMGIPINGKINSFQTKLTQKGLKVSNLSKYYPDGVRAFEGYFTNEKANIVIFYNVRTRSVYQCRVAFEKVFNTIDEVKSRFNYYKEQLKQKHVGFTSDMFEETENDESFSIAVIQPPIKEGALLLGYIELYIHHLDSGLGYQLWIDYTDRENMCNNEEQNTNDL